MPRPFRHFVWRKSEWDEVSLNLSQSATAVPTRCICQTYKDLYQSKSLSECHGRSDVEVTRVVTEFVESKSLSECHGRSDWYPVVNDDQVSFV